MVFVIDAAASVASKAAEIWQELADQSSTAHHAQFSAVMFADHGDEPFVVRDVGPFPTLEALHKGVDGKWIRDMRVPNPRSLRVSAGPVPPPSPVDREAALEDAISRCLAVVASSGPQVFVVVAEARPRAVSDCPSALDFEVEMDHLLSTGSRCFVVNDLQAPHDTTWDAFDGRDGFERASMSQLEDFFRLP